MPDFKLALPSRPKCVAAHWHQDFRKQHLESLHIPHFTVLTAQVLEGGHHINRLHTIIEMLHLSLFLCCFRLSLGLFFSYPLFQRLLLLHLYCLLFRICKIQTWFKYLDSQGNSTAIPLGEWAVPDIMLSSVGDMGAGRKDGGTLKPSSPGVSWLKSVWGWGVINKPL